MNKKMNIEICNNDEKCYQKRSYKRNGKKLGKNV